MKRQNRPVSISLLLLISPNYTTHRRHQAVVKKGKRIRDSDINNKNTQEWKLEKHAMLIMKNGKKRNNRRNRTIKSRKNQNTWKKGKLQVFGNIGSRHHPPTDEMKNKKRVA